MEDLHINLPKAIEYLLYQSYSSEFVVIDKLNQHPRGLNFYEWLFNRKLISEDKIKEIRKHLELIKD